MQARARVATWVAGIVAALGLVIHADVAPTSHAAEVQLQLGTLLFGEGRVREALDAFQRARGTADRLIARRASVGIVRSALTMAEFDMARTEAETLIRAEPESPEAMALWGDSLWAAGLFTESEAAFKDAISIDPDLARGHHGLARLLASRTRYEQAMGEAQLAIKLSPRDGEIHHTLGTIYERMHRFEEAAAAYTNYVNLLPDRDRTGRAAWSRAEISFLKSFGERTPFLTDEATAQRLHTVPFKLVNEKIVVRGRVNGAAEQDFIVDTGSEQTVLAERTAQRQGVVPLTYTLSAGVGEVGLRGLQIGRLDSLEIGTLKVRNVPCLIKNPPLRDMPTRESNSFSPLALGFSMVVDYRRRLLTVGRHLPDEQGGIELPLSFHRLATVRGVVNDNRPASFVVDTGGEVISISQATASRLTSPAGVRRIPIKVYGTSGWDRDAFLMPGVSLAFDQIAYRNLPVVVLNLRAPSALLGFEIGGTVGHKFLSRYRVAIDLERGVMRLTP